MEIYHLLNRGVEKRNVVLNDADRVRFIHDLYAFNDLNDVDANHRFREFKSPHVRVPLVDIYAFCLMPNHYHILASEIEEGGISMFMRKLNMGYAKYFNEKYKRSGVLWQGTFKRILLQRDAHFLHIPFYIHLNPLDMAFPQWRAGKVRNIDKALKFLAQYRWSSYLDYSGVKNFPSILSQELLADVLGSSARQKRIIKDIISSPNLAREASKLE
ncbi:hypothetical protein A2851_03990 [Candidatus Kaiserbacteria bacterium RIFCSPHIGHO2_01_FULL_53_29]|uniref:Transposase IS200-like domain-containing protein n=1 Tax=Candidatus Kaiserbacteria bacterium RIFCSPHIGHO2_01_FULL_53_29 TaxID=1798480 RepID=A0A1F6CUA4_9BACT|nr:MAG: hypothetical protein A2851_03990 [Candidatus Kaiserbacteria bacterium RIFCSPHIGHO2_01_FULL_53_29]